MPPPGGEIYYFFHTNNAKFPSTCKKIFGYLQYPRSVALHKFCVHLKKFLKKKEEFSKKNRKYSNYTENKAEVFSINFEKKNYFINL